jgi:hypothetical protein
LLAQRDGPPLDGAFPPTAWPVGEPLDVTTSIDLPGDLAPGRYRLALGWYDLATGARLPMADDNRAARDHIVVDLAVQPAGTGGSTRRTDEPDR